MTKTIILIEGRRDGYTVEQIDRTMTVGELINYLKDFNEDAPVMLNNDNGYTYGSIERSSIEESEWSTDEDGDLYRLY